MVLRGWGSSATARNRRAHLLFPLFALVEAGACCSVLSPCRIGRIGIGSMGHGIPDTVQCAASCGIPSSFQAHVCALDVDYGYGVTGTSFVGVVRRAMSREIDRLYSGQWPAMATKLKGGSECNGHGIYSKLLAENMETLPRIDGSSTISGWMIQFKFNPHTWSGLLAMFQATQHAQPTSAGLQTVHLHCCKRGT